MSVSAQPTPDKARHAHRKRIVAITPPILEVRDFGVRGIYLMFIASLADRPAMSRLYGLDALRGVAACVVVFGHIATNAGWDVGNYGLSVDFFFMLSGYIMARTYETKLRSGLPARTFFLKRFVRLWPVAAAGLTMAVFVAITVGQFDKNTLIAFALGLFFLPYGMSFALNVPRWSLFTELVANAAHGLIFARVKTKTLVAFAFIALCLLSAGALKTGRWPGGTTEGFWFSIPRALYAYSVGIILYRLIKDRALLRCPTPLLVLLFPATILAFSVSFPHIYGSFLFCTIACPLFLAAGLSCTRYRNLATTAGALSYPLYGLHYPVIILLFHFGLSPASVIGFFSFVILITFVVTNALLHKNGKPLASGPVNRCDAQVRPVRGK